MYQTTVTIGRNIGTEMMRHQDWERFGNSVKSALAAISDDDTVEIHNGMGRWVNADGTTSYEDSMHLTVRHTDPIDPVTFGSLDGILASLALTYGQEAIAVASGLVVLVTPSRY